MRGRKITALSRRGKFLLVHLDNGAVMVLHLGMSGRLRFTDRETACEAHTHLIFSFAGGGALQFRDPRRFGSVDVCKPGETCLQLLGVEPLSVDFTRDYLGGRCAGSRRAIKTLLMDQRVVVGVGNIYVSEALFVARIHPLRESSSLNAEEIERLRAAIVAVLNKAVQKGGTTLNDFRDAHGEPGFFQMELMAYDREGQPCACCGGMIQKLLFNGRSAYVCETCQK